MLFNGKLIGLRNKKKDLIEEINKDIDRLEQIQFIIGKAVDKQINRPSLRPEEIPEK